MTLFSKPFAEMSEDDLREELAYWQQDETGEHEQQGCITEIENELKIRTNVKTSGFKVTGVPRVEGTPDWVGTATIGALAVIMYLLYFASLAVMGH